MLLLRSNCCSNKQALNTGSRSMAAAGLCSSNGGAVRRHQYLPLPTCGKLRTVYQVMLLSRHRSKDVGSNEVGGFPKVLVPTARG